MNRIARSELLGLHRETGHTEYVFFNEKTQRSRTDLKNGFRTACVIAGLDDLRFHDLRHTAATRLADAALALERSWRFLVIDVFKHLRVTLRHRGLRRAVEALAQRQTRTVTKVPTIAKQRQLPAA